MTVAKKYFKRLGIVVIVFVVISLLFGMIKGIFFNKPETYVPMDDKLETGQSLLSFVITHGLPDRIDTSGYDINYRISLDYNDKEIISRTMDCSYEFVIYWLVPFGGLCSATYSQEGDDYEKESFYNDVNTYLKEHFPQGEYVITWEGEGMYEESDLYTDYSFNTGAIGQNTYVVATGSYGYVRFEWMW